MQMSCQESSLDSSFGKLDATILFVLFGPHAALCYKPKMEA